MSGHASLLIGSLRGADRTPHETALLRQAEQLADEGAYPRACLKCWRAFESMLLRARGEEA